MGDVSHKNIGNRSLFPSTYALLQTPQEPANVLETDLIYIFWAILANTDPYSMFSRNQSHTKPGRHSCTAAEDQSDANFDKVMLG
ncbi:hypothetical protein BTUL_0337g00050 [Botrytis tulipae]|uniref:Uncharacterized protein n=1 Tax=Botrytis tulipae TaxID=87230 RepID=A0A4Z1ECH1_9HELO|nr:hypothetical protein BTUL_0337g00050 [Botrytis tulipae]